MNELNYKLKSRYKIKTFGRSGDIRNEMPWAENMVLNGGLVAMLGSVANNVNIRPVCGTGNSAVIPTNTTLASFLAGSLSSAISVSTMQNTGTAPYYVKHTFTWRFPIGAVVGNVAEVGAAMTSGAPTASTALFSRALVVDANGDPSTVTVLSDEYLELTYELFIYAPADLSGSFNQMVDGVSTPFSYTIRPSLMATSATGWRNAIPAGPFPINPVASSSASSTVVSSGSIQNVVDDISGTASRVTSGVWTAAANTTSFYRDSRYSMGLDDANISISAFRFGGMGVCFQMSISPPLVKVSTKTYYIDIRYSVSRSP